MADSGPLQSPAPSPRRPRLRDRVLSVTPVLVVFVLVATLGVRFTRPDMEQYPDYSERARAEVTHVRVIPGSGQAGMGAQDTLVPEVVYTVQGVAHTAEVAGRLPEEPSEGDVLTVAYDPSFPGEPASLILAADPAHKRPRLLIALFLGWIVSVGLAALGVVVWRNPYEWTPVPGRGGG